MICKLNHAATLLLLCLPLFFMACDKPSPTASAKIGQAAPSFSLYDNNGRQWSLGQEKGKVVFVNFWATGCPSCRKEMPSMQKLYQELDRDKFEMLTILYNDDPAVAENFTRKFGYTFPVLLDYQSRVAASYGVTGVPETYIVDKDGILRESYIGAYDWGSPAARQMLAKYIK